MTSAEERARFVAENEWKACDQPVVDYLADNLDLADLIPHLVKFQVSGEESGLALAMYAAKRNYMEHRVPELIVELDGK